MMLSEFLIKIRIPFETVHEPALAVFVIRKYQSDGSIFKFHQVSFPKPRIFNILLRNFYNRFRFPVTLRNQINRLYGLGLQVIDFIHRQGPVLTEGIEGFFNFMIPEILCNTS